MPLHDAPVDHVAVAVEDAREARRLWQSLSEAGAKVIERLHLWPDDNPGCPGVEDCDVKWMTTLDLSGLLLVVLAPHNGDDLIAKFLRRAGGRDVHHIAYGVSDIDEALAACLAHVGVSKLSVIAVDPDALSQVFLRCDDDHRIVELVQRAESFTGTFTCRNVAALTQGERSIPS